MEPEENKIIGFCHICGGEIYEFERYAKNPDGQMIHCATIKDTGCVNEEWSNLSLEERLELLGYEVVA